MIQIIVDSERQKNFCLTKIKELELDGSDTVVFKKTDKSPSARQLRLRWLWFSEVSKSGLGRNDTKEGVDLTAKWQFARPILLRDDDTFAIIYDHFMETVKDYSNKSSMIKEFTMDYISIEKLMSMKQEAEFLTDFQNYWTRAGVALTDPSMQGVNLEKMCWENK